MKGRGLTVNVKVGDATLAELAGVSRGDKASCFIVSSVGTVSALPGFAERDDSDNYAVL